MRAAFALVLALLTVEGLLLIAWPAHVRAIIRETPEKMLRVVGVLEIVLVLVILVFAFKLL